MQILTLENTTYLLNKVPDEVDEDMRFSVLDNSDPKNPDFFFVPLIYLESFSSPSAVYVGLFLNTSGNAVTNLEAGTLTDEVSGNGYA